MLELRSEYRACIALANATDSKREDAELRAEAAQLLTELRARCTHAPTVTLRSPYDGSYSYDYDDARPGQRICLCCGLMEYSYVFDELKTPRWRFEGNAPSQLHRPLEYLLAELEELAAGGYSP